MSWNIKPLVSLEYSNITQNVFSPMIGSNIESNIAIIKAYSKRGERFEGELETHSWLLSTESTHKH